MESLGGILQTLPTWAGSNRKESGGQKGSSTLPLWAGLLIVPTAHPWAILDMDVGNGYAAILGKGGASYCIWQDASSVKVYEAINNTPYERSSFPAANAAGQTHSYQALYDPLTGKLQV